jgi:hypothetical protein
MLRKLALAAALLAAPAAHAGQFCVTSQQSAGDTTLYQFCQTVSDAGIQYMGQVAAASFYPNGVLVSGQVGGTGANAPVYRAPTVQELINAMGLSVWQGWQANATSYQRAQAAAAAVAPIQPLQ